MRRRFVRRPGEVLVGMVLSAVVLSGCGPRDAYSVAVRPLRGDLKLGQQASPTPAPQPTPSIPPEPSAVPGPTPPSVPTPASSVAAALPTPSPVAVGNACPAADPRSAVDPPAANTVSQPPAAGVYSMRQDGTFDFNTLAGERKGAYPTAFTRSVHSPDPALSGATSVTYHVVDTGVDYSGRAVSRDTTFVLTYGTDIKITRIATDYGQGKVVQFDPTPAIEWMMFPATSRPSWAVSSVDPAHGISIAYQAQIAARKDRVDACGVLVDAWQVTFAPAGSPTHADGSYQDGPDGDSYNFTGYYDVATQFGGLEVGEQLNYFSDTQPAALGTFQGTVRQAVNSTTPTNAR
ncbi:MAG: hypothetical protein ACYDGR_04295 [Candidatus Dormibacteria bacterium]